MRALILDDAAKLKAEMIMRHALLHPYTPGPKAKTPGDDPNFVGEFDTYRVVFTFTWNAKKLFRHMSVSVPAEGMLPNPYAVFSLAELFGFEGWDGKSLQPGGNWQIGVHDNEHCIVIVAPVRPEVLN